jgi:hypothetical protein
LGATVAGFHRESFLQLANASTHLTFPNKNGPKGTVARLSGWRKMNDRCELGISGFEVVTIQGCDSLAEIGVCLLQLRRGFLAEEGSSETREEQHRQWGKVDAHGEQLNYFILRAPLVPA